MDWRAIFDRCQGAPLFPNLAVLSVSTLDTSHDILTPIRALVSPTLREVFLSVASVRGASRTPLTVPANAAFAETMLQELSIKSPGLIQLSVYPSSTIDRDHLMCLSRFTHMERLYFNEYSTFNEDHLRLLAQLENLTVLRASVLLLDRSGGSVRIGLMGGFPNLTELDLHCLPTHLARIMMLMSPAPRLNDLRLNLSEYASDGFEPSLAAICRGIIPHTLTRFSAKLGSFVHPPQFLMNVLKPLLQLGNLEQLEFCVDKHLPLRDEDLERIAHAWPSLRVLILSQSEVLRWDPYRLPGSAERPTLRGLIALARGCPQLDRLCLPQLDASVLPPDTSLPLTVGPERCPLILRIENLVGVEDDEQQLAVAVFLDRLFPRLELEPYGIGMVSGGGGCPNPRLEDLQSVSWFLRARQIERGDYPDGVL